MIDQIIDLINNNLDGIHENEIVLGIVQKLYRKNSDDSVDFIPGIVDDNGDAIYAGIDDINSLIIYHKINSANLSFLQRGGYGDTRDNEDSIVCSCLAIWDIRKIKLQNADMLLLLRSRFPQEIKIENIEGIKRIQIIPNIATLNSKQIFDSEYSFNETYLLPFYINLIQINYTIFIKYDQQCIDKCINCKS